LGQSLETDFLRIGATTSSLQTGRFLLNELTGGDLTFKERKDSFVLETMINLLKTIAEFFPAVECV
jgi:hypothetical protein